MIEDFIIIATNVTETSVTLVYDSTEAVSKSLENLVERIENKVGNIAVSNVIARNDDQVTWDRIYLFNGVVEEWCVKNNINFIDNSNINYSHLNN